MSRLQTPPLEKTSLTSVPRPAPMFYASRLGALSFWQQLRLRADEVGVKGSLTLPGMTVWSLHLSCFHLFDYNHRQE